MVKQIAAAVFAIGSIVPTIGAGERTSPTMPQIHATHAFLLTIDEADTRNDVIRTVRGAGSLLDLVEGRDVDSSGEFFNRWALAPSLLPPGTPEITCVGWVGINSSVPNLVRREYSQNSALWRTVEFNGNVPPLTREQMVVRLKQFMGFEGVTHVWEIVPGDDLASGDLLSKFVPLF